jgi:energy-coupling factor transporter ATP-binding protein EcfA2
LNQPDENAEIELPLDANFVEQAEYIEEKAFAALSAVHPAEDSIVRRLSVGGAKLLVGPRGCGKTTLMLKAFYGLLRDSESNTLPVYVNFKISLKLEPLYINTPNATFWFRLWLNLKIYEGVYDAVEQSARYEIPADLPTRTEINSLLSAIEAGQINAAKADDIFGMSGLSQSVSRVLAKNKLIRCVLLLDDAAHAFSPRQQEDFFEFFRQIKSREISPKAAIYPGITTHSPTFHVGHDAEQIDVWIRPDTGAYLDFMRSLAAKRFNGELPRTFRSTPENLDFLAYTSFGIPRSFLNMLRSVYHQEARTGSAGIDRRKLLDIAKQSRELAHNVYDSLAYKLPAYRRFVESGREIYQRVLSLL